MSTAVAGPFCPGGRPELDRGGLAGGATSYGRRQLGVGCPRRTYPCDPRGLPPARRDDRRSRHYTSPLPEPQETERRACARARGGPASRAGNGISPGIWRNSRNVTPGHRVWSLVPIPGRVGYDGGAILESYGRSSERNGPTPIGPTTWREASCVGEGDPGTDDLHVRIESQYAGGTRVQRGGVRALAVAVARFRLLASRFLFRHHLEEPSEHSIPSHNLLNVNLLIG